MFKKEILGNQKEIVSLVRNRWRQGLRPDGSIIGEYASIFYEQEKRARNPLAGGNVDLIDTGALNRGLVVNSLGNSLFTIFSDDEKAISIAAKYGLDVYGLTVEEQMMVVREAANNIYKKELNGLF